MAGEIRRLFVTLGLRDTLTPKLQQINQLTNQTAMRMVAVTAATEGYGTAGKSLAGFFNQVDAAERTAIIRGAHQSRIVQDLLIGYSSLKDRAGAYATSFTQHITALNTQLEQHRLQLMLVGGALVGLIGLTLKGAIAEEKYRRNVTALSGVIDYQHEGQENINRALQDYISLAEKEGYISKDNRAKFVSEMVTMGAAKDTLIEYGPVLEKLGISTAHTTEEVINAVRSSLVGMHRPFKNLGITIEEADIKGKIEEIRSAHQGWSEDALRAQAIMEVAYPQMTRRIGDFSVAVDSAYGDSVKLKEKLSDLSGDIGEQYIPLFRGAVDIMTRFTQAIQEHPILAQAIAIGTLSAALLVLGDLALPMVIKGLTFWKGLTIWHTVAQAKLALVLKYQLISAEIAAAYATGGLSAAFATLATMVWATLAPLLPFIAAGLAIVGVVLLVQDALTKGWSKSYLGQFFGWLKGILDKIPTPLLALLGPIGLVLAAFKHWGDIKRIVGGVGASIKDKLGGAVSGLVEKVKKHQNILLLLFGPIGWTTLLVKHRDKILEFFRSLSSLFYESGLKVVQAFAAGIKAAIFSPVEAITSVGKRLMAFLPQSPVREGPLAGVTSSGSKLLESFSRGMRLQVPKLEMDFGHILQGSFAPPRSQPVPATVAAPSATRGPVTINLGGITINGVTNPRAVGDEVIARLQREFSKYGIGGL